MVTRLIPKALWIAEGFFPARYCKRIRARWTSRTGAAREACNVSSRSCSSAVRTKAGSLDFPAMLPTVAPQSHSVNVLMKRCTRLRQSDPSAGADSESKHHETEFQGHKVSSAF